MSEIQSRFNGSQSQDCFGWLELIVGGCYIAFYDTTLFATLTRSPAKSIYQDVIDHIFNLLNSINYINLIKSVFFKMIQ